LTGNGKTILLVEDEAPIRRMIRSVLRKEGFTVLEAASGDQAIIVSRTHADTIDLAVIDIGMPGMGGMDVANHLFSQRPTMKVLYMSGMVDSVAVAGLVKGAPSLIVQKPFTGAELLGRVLLILR
jgi:two-component system, cell cycle sensor histidine kinase and response regulator CckA